MNIGSQEVVQPLKSSYVAIVVQVVRGGPLLEETFGSVLAQTVEQWELFLVCSSWVQVGSLVGIQDPRVRVLTGQQWTTAHALNHCAVMARTPYIAFLEEGDIWYPAKLACQIRFLEQRAELIGCQTLADRLDLAGRRLGQERVTNIGLPEILSGRIGSVRSSWCLRRREFILAGSFDGSLDSGWDLELCYRLTALGNVGLVTESLMGRRVESDAQERIRARQELVVLRSILATHRRRARSRRDWPIVLKTYAGGVAAWRRHVQLRFGGGTARRTAGHPESRVGPKRECWHPLSSVWDRTSLGEGGIISSPLQEGEQPSEVRHAGESHASERPLGGKAGVSLAMTEPIAPRERSESLGPRSAERMPLVSVVLPTHTGGALFEEALASALAQEDVDIEVLVIDNGANLDRGRLELRDRRIRLLVEPNRGVSLARNRALGEARGQYLAFLDHDDLWRPEKLRKQVKELRSRPDAVLAVTDAAIIDVAGSEINVHKTNAITVRGLRRFRDHYIFSTVLMKRDVAVSVGGFRPTLRLGEDVDYMMRVLEFGRALHVPERLASYRWHEGSTWQSLAGRGEVWRQDLEILSRQFASARLRRDLLSCLDLFIGMIIVRSNAARDLLYLAAYRYGEADRSGAVRAVVESTAFNPAVPAWIGLTAGLRQLRRLRQKVIAHRFRN